MWISIKLKKGPFIFTIIIIINDHFHALHLQLYTWNKRYSYAIYCSSYSFVTIYGTYYVISQHKHFVHYTSIFRSKCSVPSLAVSYRSLMSCCGIFQYTILIMIFTALLIPVPSRSKSWVCGLHFLGMQIRFSPGTWMSLSCECCVLSGRGTCVGLVTPLDSVI